MQVNFDAIEFKIWTTDEDKDKDIYRKANGSSGTWGGQKIGTLEEVSDIVVLMTRNNAYAAAFFDGNLIYQSSHYGEDNKVSEWNNLLSTPIGEKIYKNLIASPSEIIKSKLPEDADVYSKEFNSSISLGN